MEKARSWGLRNRQVGWVSMSVGALTGLVMGLWSFDGPVAVPGWLGEYGATPRRLARLGHIAFFGLGILNVLLAGELGRLGERGRRWAGAAMNLGNIGLPLVLFAASVVPVLKYLLPLPATAVTLALVLVAWGILMKGEEA